MDTKLIESDKDFESLSDTAAELGNLLQKWDNSDATKERLEEIASSISSLSIGYQGRLAQIEHFNTVVSNVLAQTPSYAAIINNAFSGMNYFNTVLSNRVLAQSSTFLSATSNALSIAEIMGTRFSEIVQPQVYLPTITEAILSIDTRTRYWQIPLDIISSFDTSVLNTKSQFSQLLEAEKAVANLANIATHSINFTSISSQIASIAQIGFADSWQNTIAPQILIDSLSSFSLKQYKLIEKSDDEKEIDWRLGLIRTASRITDNQIEVGTELSIEAKNDAPQIEANAPDLSELPVFLSNAKRDSRDLEEAFTKSAYNCILEQGKLIIQKAGVINEFCKARNTALLFPEHSLMSWSFTLIQTFCRDNHSLEGIINTLQNMFLREPIIDLVGYPECFNQLKRYQTERFDKKSLITKAQKTIYEEIINLENALIDKLETANSIFNIDKIASDVYKAMLNVQRNKHYISCDENTINDGIRDSLNMIYETRDQARQGLSSNCKDAGEADIVLCDDGCPVAILEGLKVSSMAKDYIQKHFDKTLINYDPFGCPVAFILIYSTAKDFNAFWGKLMNFVRDDYALPFESSGWTEMPTIYSKSRRASTTLIKDGKRSSLYMYAIAIM